MQPVGSFFEAEVPLNETIKHFYCIQSAPNATTTVQHLAPNLEMMIVFNFGNPVRISFGSEVFSEKKIEQVAILGPLRKMLNYELLPESDVIIIVFNPNGFYRLFQIPMDEITGEDVIDPDELLKITGFKTLWETLKGLPVLNDRIQLLKDYGTAFIQKADDATAPLTAGISYFHNPMIQPVRAIAHDSDLSERTIQLRFKKYLGYSPKELLRFIRFKQVINCIQSAETTEVDWHALIEQFAYHDQSHLIKDFNFYLGTTPQKFVRDILGKEFCVTRRVGDAL